jgi:proteasome lid subunit RPN8/RPN11
MKLMQNYIDRMIRHAVEDAPNECCGIIAGKDGEATGFYQMINAAASPYRYSMDPKELYRVYREIEDQGSDIFAIYHSHTHTEAYPSQTDVRLASWADAIYILISLAQETPLVRAFWIQDGVITEEEIQVFPNL